MTPVNRANGCQMRLCKAAGKIRNCLIGQYLSAFREGYGNERKGDFQSRALPTELPVRVAAVVAKHV